MKIALIQIRAGNNKKKNITRALAMARKASKKQARFILLPEAFNYRGLPHEIRGYADVAEAIPGESSMPFMELAKTNKVYILIGSLGEHEQDTSKVFNTSVLIDDNGKIEATYRKIHLFDAVIGKKKIQESTFLLAGNQPRTAYVGKFAIGMSICYDLRFPQLYRDYSNSGAQILCVPSCFTKTTGQAHWETLLRARAIENLSYVLAPNQVGKDSRGIICYGNSMVVDPWGKVIARASGTKEEIIYAAINSSAICTARKRLPGITA